MANLIILEGLSRTGKSTITKVLSEKYGFRNISLKNKMPEEVSLPDFYHGIHAISNEFFRAFKDETFILDRSFLSELVYSRFFNRKSFIKKDTVIGDLLVDNNFILINLMATHKNYMDRSPKDRIIYDFEDFNKQKDLFYWYFEHYKTTELSNEWQNRFLEICTNDCSLEETIKIIEENLLKQNIISEIYEEKSSDCNR